MTSGEAPGTGTLRRAVALLRPYRNDTLLLLVSSVVYSLLAVANPLLTKAVFDRALFRADGRTDMRLLGLLVGAMVAIVAVSGVLVIWHTYLGSRIGQHVMHDLRERLYRHLQRMSLRFFTTVRSGEIQARISQDIAGAGRVVSEDVPSLVSNLLFVGFSLAAMVLLSWPLSLVPIVVLPAFAYLTYRVGRERRGIAAQTQEALAEMSVITEETLSVSGALLSKVFDRGDHAAERYGRESRQLAELGIRQQMTGRLMLGLAQTFLLVAPALAYLAAGAFRAGSFASITPGTLVAFTLLQARLFMPVKELMERSISVHASLALFDRVFDYLDLSHEIADAPEAREVPPGSLRGEIVFDHVSFRYDRETERAPPAAGNGGRRVWALEDVSFTIEPGQLTAIVGPSGAGKTTVTYLIPRLYEASRGTVRIDGLDVREIRLASLAGAIGMVTQETTLFHASVRDNLLYAKPEATAEELEAATRAAFIHDRIAELDDGYDTIVGERGYRMSAGEKQRLSIARVILKDPRIMILDEATSALDTESERLVQSALAPLVPGRTTIAIAHRLSTILAADLILVVDRGRLVERGRHDELLSLGGLYHRLYERQFEGGLLEARCEDGLVLTSGGVLRTGRTDEG